MRVPCALAMVTSTAVTLTSSTATIRMVPAGMPPEYASRSTWWAGIAWRALSDVDKAEYIARAAKLDGVAYRLFLAEFIKSGGATT